MKTKHMKQALLALALLLAAAWWGGCISDPCDEPCTDEDRTYEIRRLDEDYDSLFPYDGTQKTLTYLYSNDTIESDTLVFELYDTDTIEITGDAWNGGGCRCVYLADEVRRYYYQSTNGIVKKKMRISWEDLSVCLLQVINDQESFDPESAIVTGAGTDLGYYTEQKREMGLTKKLVTPTGVFFNVLEEQGPYYDMFKCTMDSIYDVYSSQFGCILFRNTCNNEVFSLIKN
jgi:hypothetical protein